MCCLFGLIDYGHTLSGKLKSYIISTLATVCEARGTDATGIAYNSGGQLRIYKRPVPAHKLKFHIPNDASVIMGHTRMTTQGSEKKNYNNHPFRGTAEGKHFALAHNGVLHNDILLRRELHLPKTSIETDSFICVQLIERQRSLGFDSLRDMAEKVEGSFTFTLMDALDTLYIVKGDNPMCLCNFPKRRLYLYASTEEIMGLALRRLGLASEKPLKVPVCCGDILRIGHGGEITTSTFDASFLLQYRYASYCAPFYHTPVCKTAGRVKANRTYLDELKSFSMSFGYSPGEIDALADQGYEPEEIEEILYCGWT